MKFLIAASLMCLALIGQTQGGSLRGYTYSVPVPVPHDIYGAPVSNNEILIEEPKPNFKDIDTITVEQPSITQPSGSSVVTPEIQNIPLVDSLPFVDSVVNFGISSGSQPSPVVSTTLQPELPYLQPGLPVLPERPVLPAVVEEPVPEVDNTYLPPVKEISYPSEVYGPPAVPEAEVFSTAQLSPPAPVTSGPPPSDVYGPPTVASKISEIIPAPQIAEIPALPEAPVTPPAPIISFPQPSETYGPPAVPQVYEVPALPAAPVTPSVPVTLAPTPSSVYGPPIIVNEAPSAPKIAEIPPLPVAPVIPSVPVQVYGVPAAVPVPVAPTPSDVYGPPTVASEIPSVPQIVNIPVLPAAPVIPSVPIPSPIEKQDDTVQVTVPEIPSSIPTISTHTFSIRPIVSQIVNFAGQFIPIGSQIDAASVAVAVPEVIDDDGTSKSGYHYEKPVKGFRTPASVVSHVQNSATSSSSSYHVNQVIVPNVVQPSGSEDTIIVNEVKPSEPGFTIHSVSGNAQRNSTGNFNQVSIVSHGQHHIPPFPGFLGVGIPHSVYAIPSF